MSIKPILLDTKVVRQDAKWNWRLYHCFQYQELDYKEAVRQMSFKEVKGERLYAQSA